MRTLDQAGVADAGQQLARLFGLDVRHRLHQAKAGAQPQVLAMGRGDESVFQHAAPGVHSGFDQQLDGGGHVDHHGGFVHEGDAAFAAKHLARERARVLLHERVAVDQPNGSALLDHGHGLQRLMARKQVAHVFVGVLGRYRFGGG
ncbi:hypothetical protein D3C71_1540250 [compost metagenome]